MADVAVIDVGNTNIKIGWIASDQSLHRERIAYHSFDGIPDELIKRIGQEVEGPTGEKPKVVWAASVVPDAIALVDDLMRKWQWPSPTWLTGDHNLLDLGEMITDVPAPRTIGIDRQLAVWRAARLFPGRSVAVFDVGTCLTMAIGEQTERGLAFIGGGIAPGPALMAKAMHDHTALLPAIDFRPPFEEVGHRQPINTEQSMAVGVVEASGGFIQRMIRRALIYLRVSIDRVGLVITGGDADLFVKQLPELPLRHEEQLVLDGLVDLANKHATCQ